jgi:CO dehydrogenase/acetyl-CoA synthase alpha subunit
MVEKIQCDIKIIETDEGFRIEAKGNKDYLKKMKDHCFGCCCCK